MASDKDIASCECVFRRGCVFSVFEWVSLCVLYWRVSAGFRNVFVWCMHGHSVDSGTPHHSAAHCLSVLHTGVCLSASTLCRDDVCVCLE